LADAAGDSYWSRGGVDPVSQPVTQTAFARELWRLLGTASFPTTAAGYRALRRWLRSFGPLSAVGVEGTGGYGYALAGVLADAGLEVAPLPVRMGAVAGR
jgi:transposase